MIRVLLLSRYDRKGGSSRLRHLQYLPHLKQRGIEVSAAPFFDDDYLQRLYGGARSRADHLLRYYIGRLRRLFEARDFDVVWLEKEALPWLPAGLERGWLRRVPYVLDLDDAWFHRYDRNRLFPVRAVLGDKIGSIARHAAVVVTGSAYLEDWARSIGAAEVVHLPTVVDLDRYPSQKRAARSGLTIGWMGVPSTARYLAGISEALCAVCEQPDITLRLVGASPTDQPGLPAEFRSWDEATEVDELRQFDVGIAPLPDGSWERGKCGYKIIQYMAASLPVVASPVGENARIVQHGETGFLADGEDKWIEMLKRLCSDPDLRHRMGERGRERVAQMYSVHANVDQLACVIRQAAEPPALDEQFSISR